MNSLWLHTIFLGLYRCSCASNMVPIILINGKNSLLLYYYLSLLAFLYGVEDIMTFDKN